MSPLEPKTEYTDKKVPNIKKAKKRVDRLLLGAVIGGAVGSIMGIGWHSKQGKKLRKQADEKRKETWQKISRIIDEQKGDVEEQKKTSVWHILHRIFIGKNKK